MKQPWDIRKSKAVGSWEWKKQGNRPGAWAIWQIFGSKSFVLSDHATENHRKPRMVWALEVFDPENGDFSSHWQMVKRLKAKVLKLVAFPNFRRFPRYLHLKSMNVLVSQPVELTTTFTGWLGCESWLEAWQHLRINLKPDKGALKHDESLCNNVISIVF